MVAKFYVQWLYDVLSHLESFLESTDAPRRTFVALLRAIRYTARARADEDEMPF